MDIKEIQSKAASTSSKNDSGNLPDQKSDRKRKPEDIFEMSSKKPAQNRPTASPTLEQSLHLQKLSKASETSSSPQSPITLRTLEMRLTKILTSKEGDPQSSSDLAKMGRSAQERGLPLILTTDVDSKSTSQGETKIIPFSEEYLGDLGVENANKSTSPVYMFFVTDQKLHYLGSVKDYFSRKHAMLGYVPTFNEIATRLEKKETPGLLEFAGMGFLGFQYGIGMPVNTHVAANFLRLIPEKERKETFGKLLMESLLYGQYDTALLCVPHSNGIDSYDDEGYDALSNALDPGAEEVLRHLIANTTEEDLPLLADAKKDALISKRPRAAQILEDHANSLGYTLDKG